jgi:hypothetical protein
MEGASFSLPGEGRYTGNQMKIPAYLLSSLRVTPGFKVELYSNTDFTGPSTLISPGGGDCLVDGPAGDFNDATGSIAVTADRK